MNLTLKTIPESKYRLIPVASELLEGGYSCDIKTITCDGIEYDVTDKFTYSKDEFVPRGVLKIATGLVNITGGQIFEKYKNSTHLIIFVALPKQGKPALHVEETAVSDDSVPSMMN